MNEPLDPESAQAVDDGIRRFRQAVHQIRREAAQAEAPPPGACSELYLLPAPA